MIANTLKTETTFDKYDKKVASPTRSERRKNIKVNVGQNEDGLLLDPQEKIEILDFADHGVLSKTRDDEPNVITPKAEEDVRQSKSKNIDILHHLKNVDKEVRRSGNISK